MSRDIELIKSMHIIGNMVRGLQYGMEENLRTLANKLGITYPGLRILWILHFEKEMSITMLSKIGLWDISTTQRIVSNLHKHNFIHVNKSEEDSRIRLISLNQNGWKLIENAYIILSQMQADPDLPCAIEKALDKYNSDDFRKFLEVGLYICTEMISQDYVNWVHKSMKTYLKRKIEELE
ncbi:MarR family winged helix-turn-helix transcriptional regulator [Salirhabdus salicampi]|uniref:MarR family winged helix-turn-helix transcriptional regulator n=1 Tax=Salirhabdus salicampi TaxID=476102 RepID=UPI0020C2F79E|nr:MarR family transcriptional regulator [Salirhabdus salicampi]MCP8617689.1 MarR family transcriptional regulator [Salirhabdus salicampi]